ncbi:MAG: DNA repair protein RecN, partial [Burkholderiales bacterium]|nr:DNA repair protein RecN [Burkholderiales bacterium]
MLLRLKIKNFILIEELELNFTAGFTVVTGETGSGKSIIIDALIVIFGGKVSTDIIRVGQIQAIFEVEFNVVNKYVLHWLEYNDLVNHDDKNSLLCKRIIDKSGKNKIYINGNIVTVAQIKQLGDLILDIHTQHASITLLRQDVQRSLLDEYALISDKVQLLDSLYKSITKLEEYLKKALEGCRENEKVSLALKAMYEELTNLNIGQNEWSELELKHKQLANTQFILQELSCASDVVDNGEHSLMNNINRLILRIEKVESVFPISANILTMLRTIDVELREINHEISYIANSVEQDSDKLIEVENRINVIFDFSRKYKINPEYLFAKLKSLELELDNIKQNSEIDDIQNTLNKLYGKYDALAMNVTKVRTRVANELSTKITELLHKLAIRGEFKVELIPQDKLKSFGRENVEYQVSFNQGLDPQPIAKVASGGELSRTALALYVLLSVQNPPEVIIFDEIDVGIGGKVAAIVGEMLKELGVSKQVICITHQPQTASYGNKHFVVQKSFDDKQTVLTVKEVAQEERVEEIARMLSGIETTYATIQHAKELLKSN